MPSFETASASASASPFLSSSSAFIVIPLLAALILFPLGRLLGWSSLTDFVPLVMSIVLYLFKVSPVLAFVVISSLSLFAFVAQALASDADVPVLVVAPWLVAQVYLWKNTSYGWSALWVAIAAVIVKNYGLPPPAWCIPQLLFCVCLKGLFSHENDYRIRRFGDAHFPDCVKYVKSELQKLDWGFDTRELMVLCLRWGDRSVALFCRVAEKFTNSPASPELVPLPPTPAQAQPTPQEPEEEAAKSQAKAEARRPTPSASFRSARGGSERNSGRAPALSAADRRISQIRAAQAKRYQPPTFYYTLPVKEKRRPWVPMKPADFGLPQHPKPLPSVADLWQSVGEPQVEPTHFINGAPFIGAIPPPPMPIAGPQIPPVQPYQPVFYLPEGESQAQPGQVQSVVVYPTQFEAAPAIDQPIMMHNLDGTPAIIEVPEDEEMVPAPSPMVVDEEDIPEHTPMEEDEVDPVMTEEEMEAYLTELVLESQPSQSEVHVNDQPVDNSGYESLDDVMGGSPYNNCKIRLSSQAPAKSQFQPMTQPAATQPSSSSRRIAKPRALRSLSNASSSSDLSSLSDVEQRLGLTEASSSTSQSQSQGTPFKGLHSSMYNNQGLQSSMHNVLSPVPEDVDMSETFVPQMPSSQALPPAMQPKTTPSESPLAKALSQVPLPQVPFQGQLPMPTATPSPSVPSISQLSVPQQQLPQGPFNVPVVPMSALSPLPPTPESQPTPAPLPWFGFMPATPPTPTPQPKQQQVLPPLKPQSTSQQKPSTKAAPTAPKAQATVHKLTWPSDVPQTQKAPEKTQPTTSQKPAPKALPQSPKPPKVSAQLTLPRSLPAPVTAPVAREVCQFGQPILIVIPDPEPEPAVQASKSQMAGRRVIAPKSRRAQTSINPYQGTGVATSPTSGNAAPAPAPAPASNPGPSTQTNARPQPLRLPGKSKPANPSSTITQAGPSSYKGKGRATDSADQDDLAYEAKVLEYMEMGHTDEEARTRADRFFYDSDNRQT
ncbi:uncharacterized protein F4812DRAFT_461784 [Daldinia caldariorum]|uniref:uncharacterized protein n=1 Tax=Daldinia caldariorum TaxID=326644 RepID=UPI002007A5EB|nr:uncharacterized protein F4812DRAFT_461784 [Daldinia caldariorum]KAI1465475.1 hypothetical protein F4812DRAFT_461784 [Daldinia caldariorum]